MNGGSHGDAVVVAPIQNKSCRSGVDSLDRDFRNAVMPKGRSAANPPLPQIRFRQGDDDPVEPHVLLERAAGLSPENQRRRGMIREVLSDAGQVRHDVDPVPAELRRIADPGQHEHLRRIDRPAGEDHLARRSRHGFAALRIGDTGRPRAA